MKGMSSWPRLSKTSTTFISAKSRLKNGGSELSLEELFDEWTIKNPPDEDSLAVQASIRDMENGETERDFYDCECEAVVISTTGANRHVIRDRVVRRQQQRRCGNRPGHSEGFRCVGV